MAGQVHVGHDHRPGGWYVTVRWVWPGTASRRWERGPVDTEAEALALVREVAEIAREGTGQP